MSSTKQDKPQIVVKAPLKHAPSEHPATADPAHSTEPSRHAHESKTLAPFSSPAPVPLRTSHPLRWFLLIVLIAGGTAAGTTWYQLSQQVVDDRHLVLQGNIDVHR